MNKIVAALSLCLSVGFLSISHSHAQTIYNSNSGFFTPVVKSLYLQGGSFEDTQLIGPAVGYRFKQNYDLTLHTEFLSSETKFSDAGNPDLTLLNVGIILGRTTPLSQQLSLRSEASLYKSFTLNTEGYADLPDPSLTSGLISSALYRQLPLSGSVSLFPHIGAFLGYGDYTPSYTSANLRQGFDGFAIGPKLGFDASFRLSGSFFLIANPEYRIRYNTENENSVGTLLFNVQLNF